MWSNALFLVAADQIRVDRRLRLVALPVAYEGAAVEKFAPVPLFGGIGDRGAERFPADRITCIPWDAGVAVVFWVGVGPLGTHSASQLGRRPRMCGVVKCLVMLLMLRWVRLVMPSSGVWVVHPFGLGKVWVTEPPRRMSMAFGWASSSSSVGMVRQTAACDGFVG